MVSAVSGTLAGDSGAHAQQALFRPSKTATKLSRTTPSTKWDMEKWWNTGSSMVRKQNQRKARFCDKSDQSRRKEATSYGEQINSVLTINWG